MIGEREVAIGGRRRVARARRKIERCAIAVADSDNRASRYANEPPTRETSRTNRERTWRADCRDPQRHVA